MPLPLVKRCAKQLHVTLNDLLMNIWLDVLDEYLLATQQLEAQLAQRAAATLNTASKRTLQAPQHMCAVVPFNVRPSSDRPPAEAQTWRSAHECSPSTAHARALGNKFAVLLLDVPMGSALHSPTARASNTADVHSCGAAADSLVDATSFCRSPFLRRLHVLSSNMTLLKGGSLEALLMYATLSILLGLLPLQVASYLLELYAGMPSVVITNNRSADAPLLFRIDHEADANEQQQEAAAHNSDGAPDAHATAATAASALVPCVLDHWVSWAPQRNDANIAVTLLTYAGQLRVSIVAEQRCLRYATTQQLVERYQQRLRALIAQTEHMQHNNSV